MSHGEFAASNLSPLFDLQESSSRSGWVLVYWHPGQWSWYQHREPRCHSDYLGQRMWSWVSHWYWVTLKVSILLPRYYWSTRSILPGVGILSVTLSLWVESDPGEFHKHMNGKWLHVCNPCFLTNSFCHCKIFTFSRREDGVRSYRWSERVRG